MPLRIEQFPASLERGLQPLYLFGGSEPLLIQECRDQVRKVAQEQGFDERDLLEVGRGFDWDRLRDSAAAPSLFSARRILDLRLPTGKPGRDGAKALVEWAQDPDPDTLLIVSCEQWDASSRKAKWSSALDSAGVRVDIWPVKAAELPRWIGQRMKTAGLEPDRDAVMVLADRLEGNLMAAQQEIEKLVLIKGKGPVSSQDVLDSVNDSARFDAFLLVERVMSGDLQDALRVATGLRRMNVPIQLITGALVKELKTLEAYRAGMAGGESESTLFRRLNVWQSRQGALRDGARRNGGKRLADAWSKLASMDRQSKGRASGDPWHSLDQLACLLCAS